MALKVFLDRTSYTNEQLRAAVGTTTIGGQALVNGTIYIASDGGGIYVMSSELVDCMPSHITMVKAGGEEYTNGVAEITAAMLGLGSWKDLTGATFISNNQLVNEQYVANAISAALASVYKVRPPVDYTYELDSNQLDDSKIGYAVNVRDNGMNYVLVKEPSVTGIYLGQVAQALRMTIDGVPAQLMYFTAQIGSKVSYTKDGVAHNLEVVEEGLSTTKKIFLKDTKSSVPYYIKIERTNGWISSFVRKMDSADATELFVETTTNVYGWDALGNANDMSLYATKEDIANMVTSTEALTNDTIVLGNGNKSVKASSYKVSTADPTGSESNSKIPTQKAVATGLAKKQNTINVSGILKSDGEGVISEAVAGVDYLQSLTEGNGLKESNGVVSMEFASTMSGGAMHSGDKRKIDNIIVFNQGNDIAEAIFGLSSTSAGNYYFVSNANALFNSYDYFKQSYLDAIANESAIGFAKIYGHFAPVSVKIENDYYYIKFTYIDANDNMAARGITFKPTFFTMTIKALFKQTAETNNAIESSTAGYSTNIIADSSTKLETPRRIDGLAFDGTADVNRYYSCSTAGSTQTKEISASVAWVSGLRLTINFANSHTAKDSSGNILNPKLKIGSITKNIKDSEGNDVFNKLKAGVYDMLYDGTQWRIVGGLGGGIYWEGE